MNFRFSILLILILTAAFLIRLAVALNAGEMFDEFAVVTYGEIYWGGIKNLDFSDNIWRINYEHPPLAKYVFGLGGTIERNISWIVETFDSDFHPDKGYFLARLFSVLIGVANIYLIYLIGKQWFGKMAGIASAAFMAFMPHLISHNAIAGLETLQPFLASLLVYFYVKGVFTKNNLKLKPGYMYLSFISFALLFLVKFSGGFYISFYLAILIWLIYSRKINMSLQLVKVHLIGVVIFGLTVYLLWPWLWANPLKLFESFSYFRNAHSGEYFLGSLDQPEWYYYSIYFIATTPPAILLLSCISFVSIFLKNTGGLSVRKNQYVKISILWLLTPFVASVLGLKQDGIRYVISYVAPLSLLAGYGYIYTVNSFKNLVYKVAITLVIFLSIGWSIFRFFPYYLDYYNYFVGGLENVYERKLLDYGWWGEGIKESILYVNDNYNEVSVLKLLHPAHTAPEFKEGIENLEYFDYLNKPDVILLSEYYLYYDREFPFIDGYKLRKSIKVESMPLVRIYEKKD